MFGSILGTLSGAKDKAFEVSAKAFINRKIANFGQVTALQVDSSAKSLTMTVELKGEVSPITVTISRYEVLRSPSGKTQIRVLSAKATREWMEAALKEFVVGRAFDVPDAVSSFL